MERLHRTVGLFLAAIALPALVVTADPWLPEAAAKRKRKRKRFLKVKKFKPRHGKLLADIDGDVRIRFSKKLDPATVSEQTVFFGKLNGDPQPWTFSVERNGRELVLSPADGLEAATDYQIRVRPGVLSDKGLELKKEKFAFFFTELGLQRNQLLLPEQIESVSGGMGSGRAVHSATLLDDGTILTAGGYSSYTDVSGTAEVFSPNTEGFTGSGRMNEPRAFHAGLRVEGGALLVGGFSGEDALRSTERFRSSSRGFSPGPSMLERRDFVSGVRLADGRLLVAGGLDYSSSGGALYSDTAEIIDPALGSFRFTLGQPQQRRAGHSMTLLADGRVLIVGGAPRFSNGVAPRSSEIFDPTSETFRLTTFQPGQARSQHGAVLIENNGLVLIADGGSPIVEVYEPETENFFFGGGSSEVARASSTLSIIPDGLGLIVGGLATDPAGNSIILRTIDVYDPEQGGFGRVLRSNVQLPSPRAGHTATTLPDGRVLFAGGWGPVEPPSLGSADLFIPRELLEDR